ncbi:MAG: DUF1802 family protein [Cyanobacteria bacterium J06642_12]
MISGLKQSETSLTAALKEWNVAVEALAGGEAVVLLRKGGIREQEGRFYVRHNRVVLYPTFEHQTPHLLKPTYASGVREVESGWHPSTIKLSAWAVIDHILSIDVSAGLDRLQPFHVWNQKFVSERLQWNPHQLLYLLVLRTYRLPSAIEIPYLSAYGGCRSWINLATAVDVKGSLPVLSDRAYEEIVAAVRDAASTSRGVSQ